VVATVRSVQVVNVVTLKHRILQTDLPTPTANNSKYVHRV